MLAGDSLRGSPPCADNGPRITGFGASNDVTGPVGGQCADP
ncbi:hypothetical protein [Nocardiopsis halotolerans]|nr:hypothetical protein [Nocardiopsis halotolerans]